MQSQNNKIFFTFQGSHPIDRPLIQFAINERVYLFPNYPGAPLPPNTIEYILYQPLLFVRDPITQNITSITYYGEAKEIVMAKFDNPDYGINFYYL
jgi:hypothetical protein